MSSRRPTRGKSTKWLGLTIGWKCTTTLIRSPECALIRGIEGRLVDELGRVTINYYDTLDGGCLG
eukprot:12915121-Prorocentrum_lima.AAC.1